MPTTPDPPMATTPDPHEPWRRFPPTRYQGSKYKLLAWLASHLAPLDFSTFLDAFGGTGAVSYLAKTMGKTVFFNDALRCNWSFAKALIENPRWTLSEDDLRALLAEHPREYDDLIARNFQDIYFTDDENRWLDRVIQNILHWPQPYLQACAFWALSQAALSKRPYNLFHRKNLYLRTADVERSFGNKRTWDRPFEEHFRKFVAQCNQAVFDNGRDNQALCFEVMELEVEAELVYIDPPYLPQRGNLTRYRDFYHFLEGMWMYPHWEPLIDGQSKHRKLRSIASPWEDRRQIHEAFEALFAKFQQSILVVSYRRDGIPSIEELQAMLQKFKADVEVHAIGYQYALSKSQSQEVLLIGR